ncbi:hypothetical protein B0H14DRAFT_3461483 [Mycena olivaceomarginata]|nr:hypothetical protein B0H14DRAFT_3461483 [Mycena olivaceomarginata]
MHDGKHVLSLAVVPAITRAATSDNTGCRRLAIQPHLGDEVSTSPIASLGHVASAAQDVETPPRPALLEQARIDERNIGLLRGGSKRTAVRAYIIAPERRRSDETPPVEGRDFLMLVISIPAQLAVGMWFLYMVLGWLVWVGVASIILLVPVPGYNWSSLYRGSVSNGRMTGFNPSVKLWKFSGWYVIR